MRRASAGGICRQPHSLFTRRPCLSLYIDCAIARSSANMRCIQLADMHSSLDKETLWLMIRTWTTASGLSDAAEPAGSTFGSAMEAPAARSASRAATSATAVRRLRPGNRWRRLRRARVQDRQEGRAARSPCEKGRQERAARQKRAEPRRPFGNRAAKRSTAKAVANPAKSGQGSRRPQEALAWRSRQWHNKGRPGFRAGPLVCFSGPSDRGRRSPAR